MSENNEFLDFYPVEGNDVLASVSGKMAYGLVKGADKSQSQTYTADSLSNNQVIWNFRAPSLQSVMDACILVESQLTFELTTNNSTAVVSYGFNDGSKDTISCNALPFHRSSANTNVQMNNSPLNIDMTQLGDYFVRMIAQEDLDKYSNYSCVRKPYLLETTAVNVSKNKISQKSLFADAYNSYVNSVQNIKNITATQVAGAAPGDPGKITLTLNTIEPLIHPFCAIKPGTRGYSNINNMNVSVNFKSVLNDALLRMVGSNQTGEITAMNLNLTGVDKSNFKLHVLYYSQPLYKPILSRSVSMISVPNIISNKSFSNLGVKINSDNISVNSNPSYISVFARPTSFATVGQLPWNLSIDNISVSYAGRSNLLSDYTSTQLSNITKKYVPDMDDVLWSGRAATSSTITVGQNPTLGFLGSVGPVFTFSPTADLCTLPSSISNNSSGSYDIMISATFSDKTGMNLTAGVSYEMLVVTHHENLVVNTLGSSYMFSGFVDQNTSLEMDVLPPVPKYELDSVVGGSIFSKLSDLGRKMLPGVKKAAVSLVKDLASSEAKNMGLCGEGMLGGARMAAGRDNLFR